MKTVEGVEISGYGHQELAQDLEMYCKISPAARDHLGAANQVGAKIEIQREGKICHAELTVVKVSRDACLDQGTGLTSMIYLTESVLFELQNAINSKRYQKLKRDALIGNISVLQYGRGFSDLEFESTAKTVQILTQVRRAGQPISPWGEKQFAGYALGPNNFANQPHDPKSSSEQRLPSKLFYAYSYLQDSVKLVKNMKLAALKKLATIKKGPMSMSSLKWGQLVYSWGNNSNNKTPAQFLVSYIDALLWLGNEVGWSVNWEGGTMADWKLCATEFVRTVPAVQHDRLATEGIKRSIEAVSW
jgi:hypothetical protein